MNEEQNKHLLFQAAQRQACQLAEISLRLTETLDRLTEGQIQTLNPPKALVKTFSEVSAYSSEKIQEISAKLNLLDELI